MSKPFLTLSSIIFIYSTFFPKFFIVLLSKKAKICPILFDSTFFPKESFICNIEAFFGDK